MDGNWVAIVLFLATTACIVVFLYLRYLARTRKMETIVQLAEKGVDVSEDTLRMMSQEGGPVSDLRRGVIFISISIPIIIACLIAGDVLRAVILGGIPLSVGMAYLVVLKFGYRDNGRPESQQETLP